MRKYLVRNFIAAHITDAAGHAQPVDLRDHLGMSLLSGAGLAPPRVVGSLPDLELTAGGNEVRIDLAPLFVGASGYSVTPMPAGVTLDGAVLTIDPLDEIAPTQITLRGLNAAGASNPVRFRLMVHVPAPEITAPTAVTLRSLDHAEVIELYEMRLVLEGTAARLAARMALPVEIAELRDINEAMARAEPGLAAQELNRQFHRALLGAARNRFLVKTMSALQKTLLILGPTTMAEPARPEQAAAEHAAVITALEARDGAAAEQAMRNHVEIALNARIRAMRSWEIPLEEE